MKLLEFEPKGRFVFVGDTHGDLDASKKVVDKYLRKGTKICFLGDYVDRGSKSMENVSYLLSKKENSLQIFMHYRGTTSVRIFLILALLIFGIDYLEKNGRNIVKFSRNFL